jgi:hypothetical protein
VIRRAYVIPIFLVGLGLGGILGMGYTGAQGDAVPVAQLYSDGTWRCTAGTGTGSLSCLVLAPPVASATPSPSATPAPTTSLTPTIPPTNTPRPTATATPTPDFEPTATPDGPITPVPTLPPAPSDCFAWVMTGLNVRSSPGIDGTKLGGLTANQRIEVFLVQVVQPEGSPTREEWGMILFQNQTAWIALWHGGQELARLDDTAACWERTATSPIVEMCLGWGAVLPDVNLNDMAASFAIWKAAAQCVVAKGVEEEHAPALAIAFGGIGVGRFKQGPTQNGDCGDTSLHPAAAARDQWDRHSRVAQVKTPADDGYWIEVDNECDTPYFKNLVWLDSYLAAEIEIFSQQYDKVIFGTMLAGGWTEARVRALTKTWEAALEHDACLGIHAGSPLKEYTAMDGLRIDWLYKYSFQHRDIRRWLVEMDPRYAAIPFCVTEWASGGGWAPYQPEEFYAWAREVRRDNIRFVAVFTAGGWPYSVDGRMAETARLW